MKVRKRFSPDPDRKTTIRPDQATKSTSRNIRVNAVCTERFPKPGSEAQRFVGLSWGLWFDPRYRPRLPL